MKRSKITKYLAISLSLIPTRNRVTDTLKQYAPHSFIKHCNSKLNITDVQYFQVLYARSRKRMYKLSFACPVKSRKLKYVTTSDDHTFIVQRFMQTSWHNQLCRIKKKKKRIAMYFSKWRKVVYIGSVRKKKSENIMHLLDTHRYTIFS